VLAVLCVTAPALCAAPTDPDAFIQELLSRSRHLADARFRIPVGVWEMYLRETRLGPPKAAPAPVAYIAEEGIYHYDRTAKPRPVLTATLRLRVFDPDKCRNIGVLTGRRDWEKVTINDKPTRLPVAKNWLRFSPPDPGLYVIAAQTVTAPRLDVLPTVTTLVRFDAEKALDVKVVRGGGLVGDAEAGTHGRIALTPRSRLEVSWGPAAPERDRPPRYALRGQLTWNLGPAAQQVAARLDVRIIGGRSDRIDLALPPGAHRVAVTGPDVRQAQVNGAAAAVFLRGKVAEKTYLALSYELPAGAGEVRRFVRPEVRGGHWSGGTFVITNTAGGSELLESSARGLRPLAVSEIPQQVAAILAGPPALAYEITARDFSAAVEVMDLGEFALRESIVDLAHFRLLYRDDGSILCKVNYEVRNRTRQFLRLELPAGAAVLVVRVNEKSRPVSPVPGDGGAYLLPLIRSKASVQGLVSFPVEIVLMCRGGRLREGKGEVELPLPRVDLPIAYAWCEAYVPDGLDVRDWSGPLTNVEQYSSETAVAQLGYGRSELAEGYTAEKRTALIARPPEPEARPERAPAPATQPAAKPPAKVTTAQPAPMPVLGTRPLRPMLALNYWRSGRDFYAKGDYDNAAKALNKVIEMAPKSSDAANAHRLLGNIRLARGELALRTRAERAAGAKVRQEQAQIIVGEAAKQLKMLESGLRATRAGKYEQARAQLKVVEQLSEKLLKQGAEARDQRARVRQAQQGLARVAQAEEGKRRQLLWQFGALKKAGRYEEALQTGQALRRQIDYSDGDAAGFQTELEELAARAAKEKDRQRRAGALREQIKALEQASYSYDRRIAQLRAPTDGRAGRRGVPGEARPAGSRPAPAIISRLAAPAGSRARVSERDVAGLEKRAKELSAAVQQRQAAIATLRKRQLRVVAEYRASSADLVRKLPEVQERLRAPGGVQQRLAARDVKEAPRPQERVVYGRGRRGVAPPRTVFFKLHNARAEEVAEALRRLGELRDARGRPVVRLTPDGAANALVVSATPERIKQVRELVRQLDQPAMVDDVAEAFVRQAAGEPRPGPGVVAHGDEVSALKGRARYLREAGRYAEALKVLKEIRRRAPSDQWAADLHDTLSAFVLRLRDKEAVGTGLREETKQLVGIREAQIPWYMLLRYPTDWPQIRESRRRFAVGAAAESPANRAVRKKLMQTHRKFEFSGVPFEQVTEFMREVSGASIHVKWNALEQAGINRDTPVNVKLTDVTIEKALRTVLDDVGGINPLGFVIDDGVITISTRNDLSRQVVTRVYDISDLIVRVPSFEGPRIDLSNQSTNASSNNTSGGGGSGGFFGSGGNNTGGGNNVGGENQVSRQQLIGDMLDLIRATISPDSWITASGTGSIREMGGQIVVSQTPENQESLTRLLEQLREAKALQINVEARFIQVTTGFLNHIGIDLDFYFNLTSRLKPVDDGSGGWLTDPLTGARIVDSSAGAFLPQWQRRGLVSNRFTPMGMRQGSFDFAGPQQTFVPSSIGGTATSSALSIAGTFLDDIQVDFLISATQANQSTRTLTAPRLTLYNSQRAYVTVSTQQAYVAGTEPEVVENVAAYRPIIATVSTGTTLDVEATISADRKYVTMTIRPQVSTVNGFTEYQGALDAAGNPIPGSGTLQLPNVTIQEVQCTVSVPDKATLLLGGQRLAGEVEREMGVPILAKIPVLNRAFTNRSIVRDEQTLLIMVRPEIIIQKEYEDTTFPE